MAISFRLATADDIPALVELENTLFNTDQISKRQFYYHIHSKRNFLWIAKEEAKLIAYMLVFMRRKSARIYSLAVSKTCHGKGVGSALLMKLFEELPAANISKVGLEVNINNQVAIRLYLKLGFKIVKTRMHYYFNGDHAYKMYKFL